MNKLLLLALVIAGPACGKKKEPTTAPAAEREARAGVLSLTLKGITVDRVVSQANSQTDDVVAVLELENKGEADLTMTKVDYSVVTAGETSEAKTWEHTPIDLSAGEKETIELHNKVIWEGTGDYPHKEAQFQGTAYYTTAAEQKTAAFKLPGTVEKKE